MDTLKIKLLECIQLAIDLTISTTKAKQNFYMSFFLSSHQDQVHKCVSSHYKSANLLPKSATNPLRTNERKKEDATVLRFDKRTPRAKLSVDMKIGRRESL
jgi:hypothetical protein